MRETYELQFTTNTSNARNLRATTHNQCKKSKKPMSYNSQPMQVIQETYELQLTTNASNPRNLRATTHNQCK